MRTFRNPKAMAKSLREVLAVRNISVSHSECLEIVAQQFGFPDWNTFSSKLGDEDPPSLPLTSAASPLAPALERVPVVPLRDVVIYPEMVIPIFAGRQRTILAAARAMNGDKRVLLVTQRQPEDNDPGADDLYQIGTLADVLEQGELQGTAKSFDAVTHRILVRGVARARLGRLYTEDYVSADLEVLNDTPIPDSGDWSSLKKAVVARFDRYASLTGWPPETWKGPPLPDILRWFSGHDIGRFADSIAAHAPLQLARKQAVLELLDPRQRLEYVDAAIRELEQARAVP